MTTDYEEGYKAGLKDAFELNRKRMVDRFLYWKLPQNFAPDGGISFERTYHGYKDGKFTQNLERNRDDYFWPIGTNLLTAEQAKEMVDFILETPEGR